jgi:hypothetical protein
LPVLHVYYGQRVIKRFSEIETHRYATCSRNSSMCYKIKYRYQNLLPRRVWLPDAFSPVGNTNTAQRFELDSLGSKSINMRDCEVEYYVSGNPRPNIVYP